MNRVRFSGGLALRLLTGWVCLAAPAEAQLTDRLDRVLLRPADAVLEPVELDRGAAGLYQALLKLTTTASVLHTTAHPDDEHSGVLALLSRGRGVRTALLSLNRGEAGANAIGPELFDGLGVIRTEELLLAGAHYGLDDLYFTTAIDYGFSKTLDEAMRSWNRERVLGDMVRVIRINRPFVVISRFHGSGRDGHGHHQAAGVLTREAVAAAGDPLRFPAQISDEGLRPWSPRVAYRGGVREGEDWHVSIDASEHSALLGASYDEIGRTGISLQRSQTGGRVRSGARAPRLYERVSGETEGTDLFSGIPTGLGDVIELTGEAAPPEAIAFIAEAAAHAEGAVAEFSVTEPEAVLPSLVSGLASVRRALALLTDQPESAFLLQVKEQQFAAAIGASLGLRLEAVSGERTNGPAAVTPGVAAVVPGSGFDIRVRLRNPGPTAVAIERLTVAGPGGRSLYVEMLDDGDVAGGEVFDRVVGITIPPGLSPTRRYHFRETLADNHYVVRDSASLHLPRADAPFRTAIEYRVNGEVIQLSTAVRVQRPDLPYGSRPEIVKVVPPVSVEVPSNTLVVSTVDGDFSRDLSITVTGHDPNGTEGDVRVEAPAGVVVEPTFAPFTTAEGGARTTLRFTVSGPVPAGDDYELPIIATVAGRDYSDAVEVIRHRDLDAGAVYSFAAIRIRGADLAVAPSLAVGYVMGVGDDVPEAIDQLAAEVELLGPEALATGDLARLDAVVVGTRAYAVRPHLHAGNARLLDYVRNGGNLIVLYQTQEFVPDRHAPHPATLPPGAEEVSEEDATVRLLAPDEVVMRTPNRLGAGDFEGWVEQRGSKFFTTWSDAYVPLIETSDTGQEPQRGVWLTSRYGAGHYTYVALALHRQLPYGVPGAYRILANLLSLGRTEP